MSDANSQSALYETVIGLRAAGTPSVLVIMVEALGSTPQDSGAKMIVTTGGLFAGTIGGGRLEAKAIGVAQELLVQGTSIPRFESWTLKGDVGMTCGGSVKLYFEPHPASGTQWPIAIFGAGHVVQALLPILQPLKCSITVYDTRRDWLDKITRSWNVAVKELADLAGEVDRLPATAFVLCMTQGHRTDRPILLRALQRRSFPYIGCIGSAAKATVLRHELVAEGLESSLATSFHCPIGLEFGTNDPHEIALSIAAQLLSERDRLNKPQP
jgi:xanthine dehydrogenase accessory factor